MKYRIIRKWRNGIEWAIAERKVEFLCFSWWKEIDFYCYNYHGIKCCEESIDNDLKQKDKRNGSFEIIKEYEK